MKDGWEGVVAVDPPRMTWTFKGAIFERLSPSVGTRCSVSFSCACDGRKILSQVQRIGNAIAVLRQRSHTWVRSTGARFGDNVMLR